MIDKFLHSVAKKILKEKYTNINSVIILPNQRSEIFLKEEIKRLNTKNIWLPDFITVDEFFQKVTGLRKADSITTAFTLYDAYFKNEKNNAKPIEEFLTWVPIMVNDFNDIDNSMVDARVVYEQLTAVKAMQQWNPDGKELSQLQKNYIKFFNSIYDYYNDFKLKLFEQKIGYQGMINRHLAENIDTLNKNIPWSKILIVGLNAFTEAEIQIFNYLNQNFSTDFVWDIDLFYFNDQNHEAAKNIKKVISRLNLQAPEPEESFFDKSNKEIKILGVPKNIGQVKFAAQEIQKLSNTWNDTAIVLPDEKLIIPLLNSLPVIQNNNYNITLGYPLDKSIIDDFFSNWLLITESIIENRNIDSFQLIKMLNNQFTMLLVDKDDGFATSITQTIVNEYRTHFSIAQFKEILKNNKGGSELLNLFCGCEPNTSELLLLNLKNIILKFLGHPNKFDYILNEQIKNLVVIISKMIHYTDVNKYGNTISLIKKISSILFQQSKMNLVGKPLEGIQIMGMLETRALDFENVIILNMNEGIVPAKTMGDSFIPYDLRYDLKLPMPSEKADIYSYNFFRLIQRAKNITLLYNSDADELGGGEKSRFILQIINELKTKYPNIIIKEQIINTSRQNNDPKHNVKEIIIDKDPLIQESLKKLSVDGFSASTLINYISCSLKFYFTKILKIKTDTGIKQSIEANTFGTAIHKTLESIYKDQLSSIINTEKIRTWIENYEKVLISCFLLELNESSLLSGKNLLIFEVAKVHIRKMLEWEIKNQSQSPSQLLYVEKKTAINKSLGDKTIVFRGEIDRVDKISENNKIRIIDYKTGSVKTENLKVADTDLLFTDFKYSKAFQVMFYAWLYSQDHPSNNIEAGIISTRNISSGFIPLVLSDYDSINTYFPSFEESIDLLISQIMDYSIPFTQTTDTKNCEYCDFKVICNR